MWKTKNRKLRDAARLDLRGVGYGLCAGWVDLRMRASRARRTEETASLAKEAILLALDGLLEAAETALATKFKTCFDEDTEFLAFRDLLNSIIVELHEGLATNHLYDKAENSSASLGKLVEILKSGLDSIHSWIEGVARSMQPVSLLTRKIRDGFLEKNASDSKKELPPKPARKPGKKPPKILSILWLVLGGLGWAVLKKCCYISD